MSILKHFPCKVFQYGAHRTTWHLTAEERKAFLRTASSASREVFTFCAILHDTGCRISEALALTPKAIDLNNKAIIVETLKKRNLSLPQGERDFPV